jgi:hypothetical protein
MQQLMVSESEGDCQRLVSRRKFPVRAETELNLVIVDGKVRIVAPQGGTLLHLLEHIFEAKNGLGDYPRHKGSVVPQVVWSYNKL